MVYRRSCYEILRTVSACLCLAVDSYVGDVIKGGGMISLFEVSVVVFMLAVVVYAAIMFNWVKRLERCTKKDPFSDRYTPSKLEFRQLQSDIEHAKKSQYSVAEDIDALAAHIGVRFVNRSVVKVEK